MNVLLTSTGTALADPIDLRFGRARHFLIVNLETGSVSAHSNTQNLERAQGAGIQAAEQAARLGAEAVISGNVGPKAFRALSAAGIRILLAPAGTGEAALSLFKNNQLKEATEASVEGHWA